ncbi:MAG: 50S ribosomal protein L2 [Candidatus Omnitrophica bacterium]|nr:50S ribosomal protein L2 [Candidatus Omnitrophota bacterium]
MGIKKYKPRTPARRWGSGYSFEEITKDSPEKSLTVALRKTGGRNVYGRITSRHRGGGHKRKWRIIDFKRDKYDIPAKVIAIEYDPNRTARIALLEYQDGEKRYIICPDGLKLGDGVISSLDNTEIKVGNALPLEKIPLGIPVYNIELERGAGAKIARSAGNLAILVAKEKGFAHVKMPSGEVRLVKLDCFASIGQVGNIEHDTIILGKAGRSRYLGIRPYSRGVAKNPVDHPMGGGEGKSSGGRHPTTPWGKVTKGLKTRKAKRSDKYILKRRK